MPKDRTGVLDRPGIAPDAETTREAREEAAAKEAQLINEINHAWDEYLAGQNEAKQREIEGAYRQKEEQDKAIINSAFEERERQESKKQKQADRNKQRDLKKAWQQLKEERTDEERAAQQANNDLKKELYEFEQVQAEATAEKKDKSVVETKETEVKDEPAGQDSLEGQPSTGILHGDDREDREAEVLQDDINKDLYEQAENYRVSGEYDKEIKIREEIKRNLIGEKIKLDNEIFENSLEIKDASLHSGNMEQAKKEILFARSFTDNIGFKAGSATTSTPEDSSPVSKTPAIPANIPVEKTVTVSSPAVNTFVSYIDSVRGFLEKYRRYAVYNLSPITYNQKIDFDIIHSLAPPFVRIAASLRNIINRSTNGGGQNDIRKNSRNERRDSRVRKSVQDKTFAGNERSSVPEFNGYEKRLSYETELKGCLNISNIGKDDQAKFGVHFVRAPPHATSKVNSYTSAVVIRLLTVLSGTSNTNNPLNLTQPLIPSVAGELSANVVKGGAGVLLRGLTSLVTVLTTKLEGGVPCVKTM
ncbi:MAG: hypothetical protein WAX79_07600, partial [Candidatus Omnitrophota bacterium]